MPPKKEDENPENIDFDKAYEELRKCGHNTVESLLKWLKDAKILEATHMTEVEARMMFREMDEERKISKEEFKTVVNELSAANEQLRVDMKEALEILAKESDRLMLALEAAAKAAVQAYEESGPSRTSQDKLPRTRSEEKPVATADEKVEEKKKKKCDVL